MYKRESRFIVEDNGILPSRCFCASKGQKRLANVGELHDHERHGNHAFLGNATRGRRSQLGVLSWKLGTVSPSLRAPHGTKLSVPQCHDSLSHRCAPQSRICVACGFARAHGRNICLLPEVALSYDDAITIIKAGLYCAHLQCTEFFLRC